MWNVSKETYRCAKRCIHMQRDVLIFTETVAMEMGYCPWYDPASNMESAKRNISTEEKNRCI